jgi:putative transposase
MVAALASRELGRPVNRKRVQRVMRAHRLLQPSRSGARRRRPGFFRVTCPDELWHADMTKVWTAQHGWVYLHAIIDCCTRKLVGWSLELRCRDDEAMACVEAAVLARGVAAGTLTLGTDNGSQFTSRDFRRHLSARGITHRRGGYRDPESQAFIESWFGQFKKRLAWRSEWESLDQAREEIASYIQTYHQRPHSGLAYRTPTEVAMIWRPDPDVLQTPATRSVNDNGVHVRMCSPLVPDRLVSQTMSSTCDALRSGGRRARLTSAYKRSAGERRA